MKARKPASAEPTSVQPLDLSSLVESLINPQPVSDERWSQLETKLDEEEPATLATINVEIQALCKRTGLAELKFRLKSSQYMLQQIQSTIDLINEEIMVKTAAANVT